MLLAPKQEQLDQWSQSLHSYEKSKRTKHPFGRKQPELDQNLKTQIVDKQMRFNPILHQFKDERDLSKTIEQEQIGLAKDKLKYFHNNYKYNVNYDIVSCHPTLSLPESTRSQSLSQDNRKKEYKDPTYNDFDIVSGRQYRRSYLEKRALKEEKLYQRTIHNKEDNRAYNIINCSFDQRRNGPEEMSQKSTRRSFDGSRGREFDAVYCRYSNPEKEEHYQMDEMARSYNHGRDAAEKLPPSYQNRQPLELNPELPVPEVVQELDFKRKMAKQRYKRRHHVEQEYKMRNQFDDEKREELAKNRVHHGRLLESQTREFNILNSHLYDQNRTEKLYKKPMQGGVYDLRPVARELSCIRQSGFNTLQK